MVHNSYVYILDEREIDNKFKKYKIGSHKINNIISGLIDNGFDVCLIDYGNYLTNETTSKLYSTSLSFKNFEYLIDFTVTLEERLLLSAFSKYTSC